MDKKILYVFAHPNPTSFNHALMQQGCEALKTAKHEVRVSDLYAQGFHAVAGWEDFDLPITELNSQYFLAQQEAYQKHALVDDINAEIKKVSWAEHIIFQFPLWWFSTPAILKGWFDRLWVKGFAYDAGKVFEKGLLKGKTASLVVSTQSPESAYQVDGAHNGTIDVFLKHIHHTLRFVGVEPTSPFVTYDAFNIDKPRQEDIFLNYKTYLKNILER